MTSLFIHRMFLLIKLKFGRVLCEVSISLCHFVSGESEMCLMLPLILGNESN